MDRAMAKVMNYSVVFFTRQFLTTGKQGEGSGQFRHSSDIKPDRILSALIEKRLLIAGNFIQGHRSNNDNTRYQSFRKQLPCVIARDPKIKEAFEVSKDIYFRTHNRTEHLTEDCAIPYPYNFSRQP